MGSKHRVGKKLAIILHLGVDKSNLMLIVLIWEIKICMRSLK